MRYYPVYLDLQGQPCVVIGGGPVAARKVTGLLEAGARVTLISPTLTDELAALAATHEIIHHPRPYRAGDLSGASLAFAATDDPGLQAAIARDAAEARVLLNVVDVPPLCGFIMPAVLRRGPVSVAVSTGGASPALAARLRGELAATVGPEWGLAATILERLRPLVGAREPRSSARAELFTALVGSALLDALRARDAPAVDAILARHVGAGASLAALGVTIPAAEASAS